MLKFNQCEEHGAQLGNECFNKRNRKFTVLWQDYLPPNHHKSCHPGPQTSLTKPQLHKLPLTSQQSCSGDKQSKCISGDFCLAEVKKSKRISPLLQDPKHSIAKVWGSAEWHRYISKRVGQGRREEKSEEGKGKSLDARTQTNTTEKEKDTSGSGLCILQVDTAWCFNQDRKLATHNHTVSCYCMDNGGVFISQ